MMPSRILLLLLTAGWVALPTSPAVRAAETALEPNATLQFEFPELGDTLATKASGEALPAKLTAQLPENYTRDGRFPVFIFLHGGAGGRGDAAGRARGVVGPRDFIAASLPLFKRDLNKQEPYGGLMIAPDDFETISRSYRVMLQKLFDVVPNVDPERSALGGFSNGGHTTAVLLAGQDEFTLRHFRAFYFVDGGFGPLAANVLQKPALQPCRFLLLRGDHPPGAAARKAFVHQARAVEYWAKEYRLDVSSLVMHGYGHELPPGYATLIGCWTRREPLPEVEPKPAPPPTPDAQK